METKHTKGEWIHTFNSSKERGVRTDRGFICFLPKPSHYDGQDERYENELDENKANAKLIASAPDLLEALKDLYKYVHSPNMAYTKELDDKCKNAITKATK